MSHDLLVYIAKTFGLIWMMGFFIIVAIRAYSPKRRAGYEHAARSVLMQESEEDGK